MANKHYSVDKEYEVTLKLKIKVTHVSNYRPISEEDLKLLISDLDQDIYEDLLAKLSSKSHRLEDCGADYIDFEIV